MKKLSAFPAIVLGLALLLNVSANAGGGIPINLRGAVITIDKNFVLRAAQASLEKIFKGTSPSVGTKERIQYDYQAAVDQAPVTVVFDFDAQGKFRRLLLDAFMMEQNVPGQELKKWLDKNAAKPRKRGEKTTWQTTDFVIELSEGGTGEDSHYTFEVKPR